MKIKVIDLLNKIANGEEVPKKIKCDGVALIYDEEIKDYWCYCDKYLFEYKFAECNDFLNDYVEIIEEPKKIEKISWREKESLAGNFTTSEKQEILARRTKKLKSSLNELIDEINNLKEKQ